MVCAVLLYDKEQHRTQNNNGAINEEEEKGNRMKSLVNIKIRTSNKSDRKLKSHRFPIEEIKEIHQQQHQ